MVLDQIGVYLAGYVSSRSIPGLRHKVHKDSKYKVEGKQSQGDGSIQQWRPHRCRTTGSVEEEPRRKPQTSEETTSATDTGID